MQSNGMRFLWAETVQAVNGYVRTTLGLTIMLNPAQSLCTVNIVWFMTAGLQLRYATQNPNNPNKKRIVQYSSSILESWAAEEKKSIHYSVLSVYFIQYCIWRPRIWTMRQGREQEWPGLEILQPQGVMLAGTASRLCCNLFTTLTSGGRYGQSCCFIIAVDRKGQ